MTDRRMFIRAATGGLLAASIAVRAQPAARIPVVGYLNLGGGETLAQFEGAMRELGYVEGRNIVIERRSTNGRVEPLAGMAAELVGRTVDVLYVSGPAAVRAAKSATSTIPTVAFDLETDPVASGLVQSLGRPGGNLTGLFLDLPSLAGKWLELLSEAVPGRKRVGVLWDSTTGPAQLDAARAAAKGFGFGLQVLEIRGGDEIDSALTRSLDGGIQALVILSSPLASGNSKRIAEFASQHRLPGISAFRAFSDAGGLMSYGPDLVAFRRIAAGYVDRLLKGAKAAELPIQQPTKFQFVVNQKAAGALNVRLPQQLLLRADEVIR